MNFLDKNGLQKLWANIVNKFATKEEVELANNSNKDYVDTKIGSIDEVLDEILTSQSSYLDGE